MKVKVPVSHEIHNVALIQPSIINSGTVWRHVPPDVTQGEEHGIVYAVFLPQFSKLEPNYEETIRQI